MLGLSVLFFSRSRKPYLAFFFDGKPLYFRDGAALERLFFLIDFLNSPSENGRYSRQI